MLMLLKSFCTGQKILESEMVKVLSGSNLPSKILRTDL